MSSPKSQARITRIPDDKIVMFRKSLLFWFNKNGRSFPWRKQSCSNYEIIISEILLQRTRAETVADFFITFIREFPSWTALSHASQMQVKCFLKPIGLWRRRAATLKKLSLEMIKRKGRFPSSRIEIESLPGAGQYIANSIELFCNHKPRPLLDTNMARVLERVFGPRKLADIRFDPYLQVLSQAIVDFKKSKEINWAILDLAASICLIQLPLCLKCPVSKLCRFHKIHIHVNQK